MVPYSKVRYVAEERRGLTVEFSLSSHVQVSLTST